MRETMKTQENYSKQEQHQFQQEEEEKRHHQPQEQEIHNTSKPPSRPSSPTKQSSPPQPPLSKPSSPLDSSPGSSLSSVHSSHSHASPPPPQVNPPNPPALVAPSPVEAVTNPLNPPALMAPSPVEAVTKTILSKAQDGEYARRVEQGDVIDGNIGGASGRRLRPNLSTIRRVKREKMKRKGLLWFRISAFVFCLVSFSVMAADKNQGWAIDSFYRYQELRYCITVNIIAFVYSGLQLYDLAHDLAIRKHTVKTQLRHNIDFSLDQMLTYLLLSASSSATFRIEDWELNWGKDKFPAMARASVVLSFLAFVAFALCSLISGHTVFTPKAL